MHPGCFKPFGKLRACTTTLFLTTRKFCFIAYFLDLPTDLTLSLFLGTECYFTREHFSLHLYLSISPNLPSLNFDFSTLLYMIVNCHLHKSRTLDMQRKLSSHGTPRVLGINDTNYSDELCNLNPDFFFFLRFNNICRYCCSNVLPWIEDLNIQLIIVACAFA